jgi:carbonic anhydrase/acetyltransferase-like protein (isoleucine patch superfamily)
MTIRAFRGNMPTIAETAFVDDTALVLGNTTLGEHVSIWPMTVLRGDVNTITVGEYTNIQDASVLHVNHDSAKNPGGDPLVIGNYVTIGHKALVHACTIGDYCLIGMGAIVMDKVIVEDKVIIGAGSLVSPGKVLESGHLYVGSPAVKKRPLTEGELNYLEYSAKQYAHLKDEHMNG